MVTFTLSSFMSRQFSLQQRAIAALCLAIASWGVNPLAYAADTEETMVKAPHKPMMAGSNIHNSQACNANGIALAGIDVVSYHKPSGPLMGNADYAVSHDNLTYHFLSAVHAKEFSADPDRYLPRYLGWCATSLAVGALTCPNPLNYKLENGGLLLFETTGFTNGQNLWNADPLDYRRRADKNRDAFLQMSDG